MRAMMLVAGTILAAGGVAAQGRPDFEFRREMAAGQRFTLQGVIGDLRVTGGSGRTVEVTAVKKAGRHGDPADVRVEVIDLADGAAICVRYPGQRGRRSDGKNPCRSESWGNHDERNDTEVNFTVRVPDGLRLRLGTVSGDVSAERLAGEIDLESVSGDVRLTGGRGPSIVLETVSGSVELLEASSPDVSGHTVSGDVTYAGGITSNGTYDFSTTSGDIRLTLPGEPDARLSAATFSGRFSSELPTSQDASRRRSRSRYDATWGRGSARLDVETLSGDIRITTAPR